MIFDSARADPTPTSARVVAFDQREQELGLISSVCRIGCLILAHTANPRYAALRYDMGGAIELERQQQTSDSPDGRHSLGMILLKKKIDLTSGTANRVAARSDPGRTSGRHGPALVFLAHHGGGLSRAPILRSVTSDRALLFPYEQGDGFRSRRPARDGVSRTHEANSVSAVCSRSVVNPPARSRAAFWRSRLSLPTAALLGKPRIILR